MKIVMVSDYQLPVVACFFLFFAMIAYWISLLNPKNTFFFKAGKVFVLFSNIFFALTLFLRWIGENYFPLSNLYESLIFLSWGISTIHLFIEFQTKSRLIGCIVTPILFFIAEFSSLTLPTDMQKALPLVPSLQSNWLMMHVTMMMISYATLIVGSLLSLLYLALITFDSSASRALNEKANLAESKNSFQDLEISNEKKHFISDEEKQKHILGKKPLGKEHFLPQETTLQNEPVFPDDHQQRHILNEQKISSFFENMEYEHIPNISKYPPSGEALWNEFEEMRQEQREERIYNELENHNEFEKELIHQEQGGEEEGMGQELRLEEMKNQEKNLKQNIIVDLVTDESPQQEEISSSKLALLQTIDLWSYRIIGLGFPFLTIGIISGAVWANEAWGSYWSWDPKEIWALVTWLVYAIYLHARLLKGWQGKNAAILGSCGFFVIWICYLGVNFLGKGLHSYGWVF